MGSDSQTPWFFSFLEKLETKPKPDSRDVCVGGSPSESHTINPTTFDRLPSKKTLGFLCLVACNALMVDIYSTWNKLYIP